MAVTDYLTCGGCQTEFPLANIVIFMEHKKIDCTILSSTASSPDHGFVNYTCFTCPKRFGAAISLLQHAQFQHKQNIFKDSTNDSSDAMSQHPVQLKRDINMQDEDNENTSSHGRPDGLDQAANNFESSEITEPLSKCCTSVIPKKRKRHFETKHRNSYFKSVRLWRHQQPMPSSDIYINVDPLALANSEFDGHINSGSTDGEDHGAFLPRGKMVTIPIPDNDRIGNYLGISYTDSSSCSSHRKVSKVVASDSAEVISNPSQMTPKNSANGQTLSTKKKYPTSKPFKCTHCEDSFNQRIHLKKHLSKHTGVKPYKCGQCDYATVERSHLKVHIRIHTGEKPFKCDHCEYSTAQNSTLKIHLKRHHSSVSLECSHCGKLFPEKTQLLYHKQEHTETDNNAVENNVQIEHPVTKDEKS